MKPSHELLANIAYRLDTISLGHKAFVHALGWKNPPAMQLYFEGKLKFEGRATGFTNGAIESAVIHSRALLEFLGVTCKRGTNDKLTPRTNSYIGSAYVEHFQPLKMMSVDRVVQAYPGDSVEAEAAIAFLMHAANKTLAHITTEEWRHPEGYRLLEIGMRGVPELVVNNFYLPLGIQPPDYEVPWRTEST